MSVCAALLCARRGCRSLSSSPLIGDIAGVDELLAACATQVEHATLEARLMAIVADEEERQSQPRSFSLPGPAPVLSRSAPVWQGSWGRYFVTRDGFRGGTSDGGPALDLSDRLLLQSLSGAFSCMLTAQSAAVVCARAGLPRFPQPSFAPANLLAEAAALGSQVGLTKPRRTSKAAAKRARRASRKRKRPAPVAVAASDAAMSKEKRALVAAAVAKAATPLHVHVIGASHQELALIPTFWPELAHLLPGYDVRLLFVGPDVPPDCGSASRSVAAEEAGAKDEGAEGISSNGVDHGINAFVPAGERLGAALCHGLYSEELLAEATPPLPRPDLCVVFNSGMGTESTAWRHTVGELLRRRVPVCTTSFDEDDARRDDAFLLGEFGVPRMQAAAAEAAGVAKLAAAGGGAGAWRYVVEPRPNAFASMMPEVSQNDDQRIIRSNAYWRLFTGCGEEDVYASDDVDELE